MYDKGLSKANKEYIIAIPERNIEKKIEKEMPGYTKFLKAFKRERNQIEQNFARLTNFFSILGKAYKGRGMRYTKLGQIVLLGAQLINLNHAYKKSLSPQMKNNIVDQNPPKNFYDLMKRCQ